ncbi:pyrimidine dimer DNA glycosylase/endonuclease V [Cellulomonas fimi]|uniref:Pyrimidine dimer DNA glycosylase n=1 Tax=Cellulomonas fimi TaxID=1708 RepID=A0A7Y0QHZ9_CELFI|nr:pyrimidine dimer DNA glycosylase/endonuclease V [Cellulomonas fimi]NMR20414.1 hypothetical protein [Cellulomonas fimi]
MRLWSVHPRYLDRQGLTASWREGLLAQKVLAGGTKGYRNHPQLQRFRAAGVPRAPRADGDPVGVAASATTPATTRGEVLDVVPDDVAGPAVWAYLHAVLAEATARGYTFDAAKIEGPLDPELHLEVTTGQLAYEWAHLRAKLALRSPDVLARWQEVTVPEAGPLFVVVPGPVADWEVVAASATGAAPGETGGVRPPS